MRAMLFVAGVLSVAPVASAIVLTVDPALSKVAVSGTVLSATITQQAAGSLTTSYSGTIHADLGPRASIAFSAASSITANNSGSWLPGLGGLSGAAPANYGFSLLVGGFFPAVAALRDLQFTLVSNALALGAGGTFDVTGVTFTPVTGQADYNAGALGSGSDTLAGEPGADGVAGPTPATVTVVNGLVTLTLPIDITLALTLSPTATAPDSFPRFVGQYVATGFIPEPSAVALLALPAALIRRRR